MKRTILVIDDEVEIGQGIKEFFAEKNFTVFTATSGKAGCELAFKEQPSLIMLDIRLPDRDGIQCLREIKGRCPESIVIMLTAVHDEQVARIAIKRGAIDYLTKPFDLESLHDRWVASFFPDPSK